MKIFLSASGISKGPVLDSTSHGYVIVVSWRGTDENCEGKKSRKCDLHYEKRVKKMRLVCPGKARMKRNDASSKMCMIPIKRI